MEKKRYIDLSGKTFGRWYVIERTPNVRPGVTAWKCRCECGKIKDRVLYTSLVRGGSNSCGCLRAGMRIKPEHEVHSQRNPTYRVWQSMRTRCRNANHHTYKSYGARGVTCCDEWFNSFDQFLADMGAKPENGSLDRIDNSKGYCKENCRWASKCEQAGNAKRNIKVIWNCMEVNLIDVARQENVDCPLLNHAVRNGKKIEIAVSALKTKGKIFFERAKTMGGAGQPKTSRRHKTNKSEDQPKIDRRYKHFKEEKGEVQRKMPNCLIPIPGDIPEILGKKCEPCAKPELIKGENNRLWRNHKWCMKRGVQYRGPKPSDWDDTIHSRFPDGVKKRETHFKRNFTQPA